MMRIDPLLFDLSLNVRPLPEVRADPSAEPSGSGPEHPVPPPAAAERHAIEDDRAGQWRGLDPAGLSPQWRGTVRQLWTDMARQGRRASTPPPPSSLSALSNETINQIAGLLPDADIGRLSLVNHRLRDALAEERKAHRLLGQALQAKLLGQFQALLRAPGHGVQTIFGLRFSRQERLLEALGERIRVLPEGDRRPAFNLIYDAVTATAFPMQHRAAPLAELARQSGDLPEDFRWDALSTIMDATDALPVQCRSEQLAVMADAVYCLPQPKHRWLVFNRVRAALARLDQRCRSAPLKALAQLIPGIPASHRRVAFNDLLAAVTGIDAQHRVTVLAALLHQIRALPWAGRRRICRSVAARHASSVPNRSPHQRRQQIRLPIDPELLMRIPPSAGESDTNCRRRLPVRRVAGAPFGRRGLRRGSVPFARGPGDRPGSRSGGLRCGRLRQCSEPLRLKFAGSRLLFQGLGKIAAAHPGHRRHRRGGAGRESGSGR
jgi:hypothetical protein